MKSSVPGTAFLLLVCCLAMIAASGCAPLHRATSPHMPDFEEAQQVEIGGNAGTEGVHGKLGFAITDDYFALAGISYLHSERTEELQPTRHRTLEIAGGRQWKVDGLPPELFPPETTVQVLGGLVHGRSEAETRSPLSEQQRRGHLSGEYYKPYVQLNAIRPWIFGDVGAITRLSVVQFDEIQNLSNPEETIRNPSTPAFVEVVAVQRFSLADFRVELQMGYSAPIVGTPDVDSEFIHMSAGVTYRFSL